MATFAHLASLVVALGFVLGLVFGAVAHKANFCTMGAVADVVNVGDWGRMRMWLLAIAVAVAGANALDWLGLVDLSRSAYPAPRCPWIAYIVGGLLFGIGMTLASGCGSRSVVRVGGGNLKSLVVLVFLAISADMTIRGLFVPARVEVLGAVAMNFDQGQDLPWVVATQLGVGRHGLQLWITALIVVPLLFFVFKDRTFRATREQVFGGLVLGLVIVAGWYVTGHIGFIAEDPDTLQEAYLGSRTARPESLTYVGPVANTLEWLQFWTDKSSQLSFGVAVVAGTLLGSFAYAILTRNFRWESFASASDTRNHIIGGILMGFGGVTAMGCTIGQGITGLSTLAVGSFLVFFSIIAGAAATMKVQYWRMLKEA
ncbi:MAG: YeeE/YedE family protein [Burkholderiales bacterium]